MGLKLNSEGFMTKNEKNQKTQKFSKSWGFPPKMRFFGFFHFLKLTGHRKVWGQKIDSCQGKKAKVCENAKKS